MRKTKLVIGLGNFGTNYTTTRHNAGFLAVEAWAQKHSLSWKYKSKFHAEISEVYVDTTKIVLAQPQTYYNDSGRSVRSLMDFYNIRPHDILVIHDDLDLDFGQIRYRTDGSSAGNNGIKSISSAIGKNFWRAKIGIKNSILKHASHQNFVLSKFSATEIKNLEKVFGELFLDIEKFCTDELEVTSKKITF